MKVLVIGSGAREHAIAHALMRGDSVSEVTVAPGNPGMELDGIRTTQLNPSNHAALIDFVKNNGYDWVFVGPEVPLIEGIVDDFAAAGIKAFGPNKAAAQIEGSKDFAKQLMERHDIPTAKYQTFDDLERSTAYVREHGAPIVIKADGLAAGKGVTVAMDEETAIAALEDIFVDHRFGNAGAKVVIEDFLEGQEFSLMSFVNGTDFWPMPISQDHKRAYDGDKGPNTGGMGAIAPNPFYTKAAEEQVMQSIILPTLNAMNAEGRTFRGCLYFGLMLTPNGPRVIEYNCRFGDPETQAVLPLVEGDLLEIMIATQAGTLDKCEIKLSDKSSCCLVLASGGYPEKYEKGKLITFDGDVEADCGVCIFHAGTKLRTPDSSEFVTSGGRVLGITAVRDTLEEAVRAAYAAAERVHFDGKYSRSDIGLSALRESRLKNG